MAQTAHKMRLEDFPPELMRMVLEKANSSSAINLWLSGAPRLLQLLSTRGSIVSIELRDSFKRSPSQWPKFLSSLKGLTHLRIKRPYAALGLANLIHEELIHMPQLKSLHLDCMDSGKVLDGGHLRRILPSLETLSVSVLQSALNATDLPRSITSIHIEIANAPINFTALDAKLELPNLTKFTCAYSKACQVPLNSFPIVKLKVPIHLLSDKGPTFPTTLTHLTLKGLLTDLALLPSTLLYLNVHALGATLMKQPFRKMTLLETLVLSYSDDLKNTFPTYPQPMFPPSLRHLSIDATHDDIGDLILPPLLESLNLRLNRNPPSAFLTEIPSCHRTDAYGGVPNNAAAKETVVVEEGLPESLLNLTVHCRTSGSVWDVFSADKVPPNLKVFKLSGVEWTEEKVNSLPSSITHLSLPRFCPTNLTSFAHLRHLELHDAGDCPMELFYQLPQTLQTLDLRVATRLDETLLEHLPTSLITLTLLPDQQERPQLTEKGMRSLSRLYNLKRLCLSFDMMSIKDWMLRMLPRTLRSLNLRNEGTQISSLCFASLPRLLKHLTLAYLHHVQPNHILALPKNLRSLEIAHVNSPEVLAAYCPPLPTTLDDLTSVLKFPVSKAGFESERQNSRTEPKGFNFRSPCEEEFDSALVPLLERRCRPSLILSSVLGASPNKSIIWETCLSYYNICTLL